MTTTEVHQPASRAHVAVATFAIAAASMVPILGVIVAVIASATVLKQNPLARVALPVLAVILMVVFMSVDLGGSTSGSGEGTIG